MRRIGPLAGVCLAGCVAAAPAAAATPCVGTGFDHPFPGATGVVTRFADVPSPQFPGLWQEGTINGHGYRMYANGEASVQEAGPEPGWAVFLRCDLPGKSCTTTTEGTPPDAAIAIAGVMERCFIAPETVYAPLPAPAEPALVAPPTEGWALAPTPSPEPEPPETDPTAPEPAASAVPAEDTQTSAPAAPCGLAAIPDGSPGLTLQRLLVAAGADPGPLDGLPGRRTRTALTQVLGAAAGDLTTQEAVRALDAVLCAAPGA